MSQLTYKAGLLPCSNFSFYLFRPSQHLCTAKGRVTLHWPRTFIAKNEKQSFTAHEPSISKIEGDDDNLCPVRALNIFLKRRAAVKNHVDDSRLWPATQSSLSHSITIVVKEY